MLYVFISRTVLSYTVLFAYMGYMSYRRQFDIFCPLCHQSWRCTDVMYIKRGITLMHEVNIYLHVTDSFAQKIHFIAEFCGNWLSVAG